MGRRCSAQIPAPTSNRDSRTINTHWSSANATIRLMIEVDSDCDPFGGSGTTYSVCERRHRHWIGIEIENPQPIIERLTGKIDHHRNDDFVERPRLPIAAE